MGVILHDPTVKFKCTLGDRSFTAAAPKIWNGLADYIKKENDFDQFKRLIKTYYFKEVYIVGRMCADLGPDCSLLVKSTKFSGMTELIMTINM